jgi:glycosyltransferase involved in cell wall biosynthesis
MKKIQLLIVIKNLDGGTGTFIVNFLKIKKLFNSKLILKTITLEEPKFRKIKTSLLIHKKKFYPNYYSFINSLKYFLNDVLLINKIVNQEKPNIILSINNYANIVISLSKLLFRFKNKIILTHHNNLTKILNSRCSPVLKLFIKTLLPVLYKTANIHVVVSNGIVTDIKKLSKRKNIKVIYNGIKLNHLNKIKSLGSKKVIVSVGRFDTQKDFFTLLEAFNILKDKLDNIKLILIGDGLENKRIKKYIKQKKLNNLVKIKKWQNNISKYLKNSTLFVFSSLYEGFSYVIIEAMSFGLPIVSTDTPFGPREILDNGKYGILIPMKDPKAMADAIHNLLTDKKKYQYYSKKSLERAKYFSLDKMLKNYKKIILDLLKEK